MKILSQRAFAGALFIVAQACATPVEIADDLRLVDPNADGGFPTGGQGGGGGVGGIAQGGSGQGGASGAGVGGSSGAAGQPGGGAGGTPVAGASGAAGAGGAPGGAGGVAGDGGAAGTGGTGSASVFDPEACDFEDVAGCEALACAQACPTNMGSYCTDNCPLIITCVSTNSECNITEQDPLCAVRVGDQNMPNTCTLVVESAGNPADPTQPSAVAREFVECLCSVPRP